MLVPLAASEELLPIDKGNTAEAVQCVTQLFQHECSQEGRGDKAPGKVCSVAEKPVPVSSEKFDVEIEKLISQVQLGEFADDPAVKEKVLSLLRKHRSLWSGGPWDLGRCTLPGCEHTLKLKPDAVPRRFPPYCSAFTERYNIKEHMEALLAAKLVRPLTSQWGSPMYLVQKKQAGQGKTYKRVIVNMC